MGVGAAAFETLDAGSAAPLVDDDGLLPRSRVIWIAAALGALMLHAAAGVVVLRSMEPDTSNDLGASGLVIDVDLAAPKVDPSDLPVGPNTDATAASPAMTEQKQVVTHDDLPKEVPTETDDPDRVVSPNDTKTPQDEPKTPTAQAQASEQSVATQATSMAPVEGAVEAPKTTAPSLGTGNSAVRERVTWEKELAAHFNKFKRYPEGRAAQTTQVTVTFTLDQTGHIVSSRVVRGSGDQAFDDAALAMLQRADPVPAPPSLVVQQGLSFTLPVNFTPPKH